MSAILARADALAAYLATVEGLEGVTWLVDRQRDLSSEFTKAISKKNGLGIVAFVGATNKDRELSALRLTCKYSITIYTKPILRPGEADSLTLVELACRATHQWFPSETPTKRQVRFEVPDIHQAVDSPIFHAVTGIAEGVVQLSSDPVTIITP